MNTSVLSYEFQKTINVIPHKVKKYQTLTLRTTGTFFYLTDPLSIFDIHLTLLLLRPCETLGSSLLLKGSKILARRSYRFVTCLAPKFADLIGFTCYKLLTFLLLVVCCNVDRCCLLLLFLLDTVEILSCSF